LATAVNFGKLDWEDRVMVRIGNLDPSVHLACKALWSAFKWSARNNLDDEAVAISQNESSTPAGVFYKLQIVSMLGTNAQGNGLLLPANAVLILASAMRDCEVLASRKSS
jgi:hypothetical protein